MQEVNSVDFIGRISELATLNAELERSSGFVVIYGRRRVGKTTLIKEFIKDKLNASAKELYGIENFTDMIGDETVAEDPETLVAFLTEKGHPALGLDPMM